jgi:hypothetical protein
MRNDDGDYDAYEQGSGHWYDDVEILKTCRAHAFGGTIFFFFPYFHGFL